MTGLPVPDGLSDRFVQAFAQVVDERFGAIPVEACLVWDLRTTPDLALLHIAEGLGLRRVLGAEPLRTGLPQGFSLIAQRGTAAGLRRALTALGYGVTLLPHPPQLLCDGSILAAGEPYHCGGDDHWAVCWIFLTAANEPSETEAQGFWAACGYFGRRSTRYIIVVATGAERYVYRDGAVVGELAGEQVEVSASLAALGVAGTCDGQVNTTGEAQATLNALGVAGTCDRAIALALSGALDAAGAAGVCSGAVSLAVGGTLNALGVAGTCDGQVNTTGEAQATLNALGVAGTCDRAIALALSGALDAAGAAGVCSGAVSLAVGGTLNALGVAGTCDGTTAVALAATLNAPGVAGSCDGTVALDLVATLSAAGAAGACDGTIDMAEAGLTVEITSPAPTE